MQSITKTMAAFKRDAKIHPATYPELPSPPIEKTPENLKLFREEFFEWERLSKKAIEINNENFETALVRMNLCSFLNGFLHAFEKINFADAPHFKWCPHKEWERKQTQLFEDKNANDLVK